MDVEWADSTEAARVADTQKTGLSTQWVALSPYTLSWWWGKTLPAYRLGQPITRVLIHEVDVGAFHAEGTDG